MGDVNCTKYNIFEWSSGNIIYYQHFYEKVIKPHTQKIMTVHLQTNNRSKSVDLGGEPQTPHLVFFNLVNVYYKFAISIWMTNKTI